MLKGFVQENKYLTASLFARDKTDEMAYVIGDTVGWRFLIVRNGRSVVRSEQYFCLQIVDRYKLQYLW